jgi:hypothetical protein
MIGAKYFHLLTHGQLVYSLTLLNEWCNGPPEQDVAVMAVTSSLIRLLENSPTIQNLEVMMICKQCASDNQSSFTGEVAVHFPGLKGLDKPIVWVFPKLLVCLHCGLTEFTVPTDETRALREGIAGSTAA